MRQVKATGGEDILDTPNYRDCISHSRENQDSPKGDRKGIRIATIYFAIARTFFLIAAHRWYIQVSLVQWYTRVSEHWYMSII